jgi:hypothetical protein
MRNAFHALAPVFLLMLHTSIAAAQHPQVRRGFWIGFGFQYGSAGVSCDQCVDFERESGFGSFLKLGGTLNEQVLLGADITGWTKEEEGVTSTLGNVTAAVYFYPAARSGFFVKGGFGFSAYYESDDVSDLDAEGTGVGLTVGLGFDLRVGRNISMTAVVDYIWGSVGEIEVSSSIVAEGWKQNAFLVGLGVTFH